MRSAFFVGVVLALWGCGETVTIDSSAPGETVGGADAGSGSETGTPNPSGGDDASPAQDGASTNDASAADAPPRAPVPVTVIATDVLPDMLVVDETLLWETAPFDGSLYRGSLDGAGATALPRRGANLASDGTSLYYVLKSFQYELHSLPFATPSDDVTELQTKNVLGVPVPHDGVVDVAFGSSSSLSNGVKRLDASGGTLATSGALVEARDTRPVVAGSSVWFVDYGNDVAIGQTRQGAVWVFPRTGPLVGTRAAGAFTFGVVNAIGGLATSGDDVFVRHTGGISRLRASAPSEAPVAIVSKDDCRSPVDGENTVAADASGLYALCDTGSSGLELRRYARDGSGAALLATATYATPPIGPAATNLQLSAGYAFFVRATSATKRDLVRAPK